MVDLSTTYLGLELRSPLVVGAAAPLTEDIDNIKRMEDAGASAVVLHSFFEEQLLEERYALYHHLTHGTESYPEAISYFPESEIFHVGSEAYLNHIFRTKRIVDIPIIASLNSSTISGWGDYARQVEQAGADGLELNIYDVPTDLELTGEQVEQAYIDIIHSVTSAVNLPVAVKLSPFFSNMANMAKRISDVGADGLVLFNRFYQPDIDLETLTIEPNLLLSTFREMRLPMRWIAILYGTLPVDFAATSGIRTADDVIKMMMVGANVTMLVSVLLSHGIEKLQDIERDIIEWLETKEYDSIAQLQGSMSQKNCPDPSVFERVQYLKAIQSFPSLISEDNLQIAPAKQS
ncbi:Dihydroorotate dehydrogenase [Hyella patelloides LEGE 07179]|uniref:Dihydroorotate dehydrogenase n=1 Tax=Hyella patelloides LEGE 07179 TaxID=945734 RepID=A0A563VLR5_9CYAN|nr:dihydroorotate dehydrogenase-like protein [Hyella patelloides]VEP12361.1 Dihydroorotate dehydrogenase [Hyella patelloides LEGE 07179]